MYPNPRVYAQQQRRVRHRAEHSDTYAFFNLLIAPELLDQVESLLPEHRERLFPPTETLSMFLSQALGTDRSCQRAVNAAAVKRLIGGLSVCSTHTGGYCRARARLPQTMVSSLVHYTGRMMSERVPSSWLWRGHPVRLVGLICLGSGAVLDCALGSFRGTGSDEQALLRTRLDTLESGDVLLGDAYYATYFLLGALRERGVEAVFAQQGARRRVTDFRRGQRLGPRDHLIEWRKPLLKPDWMSDAQFTGAPATLTVRELRVGGKILVTTLRCPKQTPKAALKALYRSRWQMELDLRHLKTTLGMELLSCKTPAMAQKEIWVYLLAYNLIRLMMAQAATLAQCRPRELSFKHTLQVWIAWDHHAGTDRQGRLYGLFVLTGEQRVGHRPGHIEPRAIKRRPKAYPLLMKPRALAREEIRRHGHFQKVK